MVQLRGGWGLESRVKPKSDDGKGRRQEKGEKKTKKEARER
jgi:hypothetical protein